MAKITLNPNVGNRRCNGSVSGSVGELVFKGPAKPGSYGEQIVVTCKPDMSRVQWSAAQQAGRERFRRAIAHGKQVLADPVRKAEYAARARADGKPIFSLVLADYYHNVGVGSPKSPDFGMYPRSRETSDSIPERLPLRPYLCWMILCLLCLATLVSGCTGAAPDATNTPIITLVSTGTATPAPTRQLTQLWTPTMSPLEPAIATATPIPSTATETATVTATVPANVRPQERCLVIQPSLPANADVQGSIFLNGEFLDLASGQRSPFIPGEDHRSPIVEVSPDGKRIAYERSFQDGADNRQMQMEIVTLDGIEQVIPWHEEWASLFGWLGNDHLAFYRTRDVQSSGRVIYDSLVAFDPFKGRPEQELTPTDPDLQYITPPNLLGADVFSEYTTALYNSALTRVAYLRSDKDGEWTAIQDVETGEVLAQVSNSTEASSSWGFNSMSAPAWSADGQELLTEAGRYSAADLYRISSAGEVTRLTYLVDVYGSAQVRQHVRSADGRYIAFWFWAEPYESYRLAILDAETGEIADLCIPDGDQFNSMLSHPGPLFWSPEGRHQFVAQMRLEGGNQDPHWQVVLVDLDQGFAAQIAVDEDLNGWIIAP